MKELILLLFVPIKLFSQTSIRYYDNGDDNIVSILVFAVLLIIYYFYYKNSKNKNWKEIATIQII